MRQTQATLSFSNDGFGLHEITAEISAWLSETGVKTGLLTLFCRHTSAGLLITENASPAVLRDLQRWMGDAVPESGRYEHSDEGPDDMPAHIKAVITGNSLTLPVADGRMLLGTWQGIFVAEYRRAPHRRSVVAHLVGE